MVFGGAARSGGGVPEAAERYEFGIPSFAVRVVIRDRGEKW
ncbi:hypothetical protein AS9A_3809 [Hoyosella subflava DQS3-9A1]|uniref:Uncharacterized protein n=1 Tax=Hoyosella subflava (strain DSM 45089 / JCM 17490 / NBRC 109087 / DQS3-9A1) TaxID=443218 RepID=F6EFY3_HOYSD|nr:hypothetical protein AS9A_3809 [Hoyosella subflava DQS3-9A1]